MALFSVLQGLDFIMLLPLALVIAAGQSVRYPIAFETPVDGGEAMQVMVTDRKEHATKLGDGQYPSNSPDGKLVVFAKTLWMADESVTLGLSSKLEIQPVDGSSPARVLATFNGPVTVSMPMFSPDGKTICFEVVPQRPDLADPQRGVYVIPTSGGKPRLIYRPTSKPAAMTWPNWTTSGKEILLVDGDDLLWVDVATKKDAKKPSSFLIGDWTKDSRISMVRACPTDPDVFAFTLTHLPGQPLVAKHENVYMNRVGATPKAVSGGGTGWHPRWTPDGLGIYFYEVGPAGGVAQFRYYDRKAGKATTLYGGADAVAPRAA